MARHRAAIDEGAARVAEIVHGELLRLALDQRVPARHVGVLRIQIRFLGAADRELQGVDDQDPVGAAGLADPEVDVPPRLRG